MNFINPDVEAYCEYFSEEEPALLQELNRETHLKVLKPRMLSGAYQGRLLSLISHMMQPQRILEVGTYTGYSALCLAEGLSANGKVHTIDNNDELEPMIRRYVQRAGEEERILLHIGDAGEVIPKLEESWDLVFIDADKENYALYYDQLIERMRPGGIILADNVLWKGKVLEEAKANDRSTRALQEFNQKLREDSRVAPLMLPVRDGLTAVRVRGRDA